MPQRFSLPDDADAQWTARARAVIPGGASTGSKRLSALYGEDIADVPTHFVSAIGCRIITAGGRELIDCTMGLGSVAIGYADEYVTDAVAEAASRGSVAGFSHVLEVHVAERLVDVIPCAERVRFLKSGAEGVAAAVRIARTHTGRSRVIGCGYFGWLDWWSNELGVPAGARGDFQSVPFDDIDALVTAVRAAGDTLAAIIVEPVIERPPSREWLKQARVLADARGAALIFDEIKTGFRVSRAGYQELSGIVPDIAVFGKAMANGYPLCAVVGKAKVMSAAEKTWISSTLAGESTALAAANAVLDWHERQDVPATLALTGEAMMTELRSAIEESELRGVEVGGIPTMWLLRFDDASNENRFVQLAADAGVLFKRGAYDFPSLSHDESALEEIARAARDALRAVAEEASDARAR
ncbi:MAG TPA: aminotransferase class III-fold pyridoxal phosphate-dependent enzyme [Gemmatimonadaceae bacterium]|nr:aminotransferase class III-fold pyridoxal phosphate-dependent enzyme [Gemmatimonadaceae bacterium]